MLFRSCREAGLDAQHGDRGQLAATVGRQPSEYDGEHPNENHALPEIRQAEPQDGAGDDGAVGHAVAFQPRPQAQRNADEHGKNQGDERKL